MLRIVILLSLWVSLGWGCLSCSYGDIKVLTHLYLNVEKTTLKSLDVEWTLDPMFSQMVLGDYDTNRNGKFDNNERHEVYRSILSMKEEGFFIRPSINGKKITLSDLNRFRVTYRKGLVIYRFTLPLNTPIGKSTHLQIRYDAEAAYNNGIVFHLNDKNLYVTPKADVVAYAKLRQIQNPRTNEQILDITIRPRVVALAPAMGGNTDTAREEGALSESLRTLTEKIHAALVEVKENPSVSTIGAILLFSLLYGILHAAGPGHGKTLVAGYFSATERSYVRAVAIALMIALTHVLSALILSAVLYYLIHTMFSQTMEDVALYTTKLSGIIILLIALYLARQKWLSYRVKAKTVRFSATPIHTPHCGCHSCNTTANSTDLGLILGAGIVPCPGTVIVFLFAISMGMIGLGIASAVIMSLGMGITIALSAAAGTMIRKKSALSGERLLRIIDFVSISIMIAAGCVLILSD